MNRWDEIKIKALDTASLVTTDRETRDKVARGLVELVGLMVKAVGKGVAIQGECDMNEWIGLAEEDEATKGHTQYLAGESMQSQADQVVSDVLEADLGRYSVPVWTDPLGEPEPAECPTMGRHPSGGCPVCIIPDDWHYEDGRPVDGPLPKPEPVGWSTEPRCCKQASGDTEGPCGLCAREVYPWCCYSLGRVCPDHG